MDSVGRLREGAAGADMEGGSGRRAAAAAAAVAAMAVSCRVAVAAGLEFVGEMGMRVMWRGEMGMRVMWRGGGICR